MRRSAAPSQLQGNSFKKPKFIPPGRSNPSLNEEIMKQSADIKVFEVASNKNTFLQSQNDPGTGGSREINLGDNYSGKYCFEASSVAIVDPHHTVQTWMRKHRLVPVHYR
ncbi:DNA repair and recombination protein RAD54B isoform X5 [Talpa occidentalis]|uniref:DNA repair and recombination protein RAD54B isoform X5 n=1 Tax=Talpa occidentalis TaxID=50954 RepID=UPI00188EA254|nr:DNA repair and recombination protein RAD54B isoform X5 [Talpa occidentalis]